MKNLIARALAITLALSLLCGSAALGESKYVSIKDIRDAIPERWTGEYTIQKKAPKPLKKGDTISIDVPVVVPEVDTVPITRCLYLHPQALAVCLRMRRLMLSLGLSKNICLL